jgi:uncharacterized protein YidB (DUF937 family)
MGLLDDLLAGLGEAGTATPQGRRSAGPSPAQAGGGMAQIMMALLPVVLGMLANRGGGAAAGPGARGGGGAAGGLDDLLGQILGGGTGSGLGGLLDQLQRAGFGAQAQSWVGRGDNLPLPSGALEQIFGQGGLGEIARRAGISEADASRGLSALLPEVVDRVTPQGAVPDLDALSASVDDLCRRFGVR